MNSGNRRCLVVIEWNMHQATNLLTNSKLRDEFAHLTVMESNVLVYQIDHYAVVLLIG